MTKAGRILSAVAVAGLIGAAEARVATQQAAATTIACTLQAIQGKAPTGTTITDAKTIAALLLYEQLRRRSA